MGHGIRKVENHRVRGYEDVGNKREVKTKICKWVYWVDTVMLLTKIVNFGAHIREEKI